jgi:hypothetical protein
VFAASNQQDRFFEHNQFRVKAIELLVEGQIDHVAAYRLSFILDEEDVELEEGYVRIDQGLPDPFELKVGLFNADFGKLAKTHEHELPFLDHPQVIQEYLGGNLRSTGMELSHWLSLGECGMMRWSFGFANALEADSHAIFGPTSTGHAHGDEDSEGGFGRRKLRDFAFTGRLTSVFYAGRDLTIQVGASAAYAPQERQFLVIGPKHKLGIAGALNDGLKDVEALDQRRLVLGADVSITSLDSSTKEGFTLAGELLCSRVRVEGEPPVSTIGFYAYFEWMFNRAWSLGISGGWFEHAEDPKRSSWDLGAFVTHHVTDTHRLRLEGRRFDDPDYDSFALILQYTIILGHHNHDPSW